MGVFLWVLGGSVAFLKHEVTGWPSWNPLLSRHVGKILKIAPGPLTSVVLITLMLWHPGHCVAKAASPIPPALHMKSMSEREGGTGRP